MPAAHQPAYHVAAHAAEPDHAELHRHSCGRVSWDAMSPTVIVDDRARRVKTFVELVEQTAEPALASRGRFTLVVTGGGDAQVFLPPLAPARVDWGRTDVFWGDERAVAPDHADSNYGQVKASWLDRVAIPPARIHRMRGEQADLEAAARAYEATLVGTLGAAPAFDLVWLGVGPDGHVCSLFPGHPLLDETRLVAAIHDSPKPPPRRITLTLPALVTARLVIVTAAGAAKAAVIAAALDDPRSELPIARVVRGADRVVLLLDADAASLLQA
jgi:6-phosphogluconolactonase